MNTLKEQIQNVQEQIDGLNNQINLLDESIHAKQQEMDEKEKSVNDTVEQLRERLKDVYKRQEGKRPQADAAVQVAAAAALHAVVDNGERIRGGLNDRRHADGPMRPGAVACVD